MGARNQKDPRSGTPGCVGKAEAGVQSERTIMASDHKYLLEMAV